ncbi:MAG: hypothetical protein V8R14_08095 [Clostridia bacterium]
MNYEELIEYLDLEDGSELEYFEAMADMIESEEYIEMEAMYRLFEEADKTMIEELLNDYFEDILDGLPDNSGEIFSLLHQIKLSLTGLIAGAEDDSDLRRFTDEFHKFRNWYSQDSEVELTPDGGGAPLYHSVRDAITASRVEKLAAKSTAMILKMRWIMSSTAIRCRFRISHRQRMKTTVPSCFHRRTASPATIRTTTCRELLS